MFAAQNRCHLAAGVLLSIALASSSLAQPAKEAPTKHNPPAAAPEAKPQAKPAPAPAPAAKQPAAPARPSIVIRNEKGIVNPIDELPAVAALRYMRLTADSKRETDRILADRNADLDKFVRANLDDAAALYSARINNQPATAARLTSRLYDMGDVIRARAGLTQELMAFMTPEEGATLRQMVQEYLQARITDEAAAARKSVQQFNTREFIRSEQLRAAQHDLAESFERIAERQARDLDELSRALGLSADQQAMLRQFAADAQVQAQVDGLPDIGSAGRARVLHRAMELLSPAQRTVLMARMAADSPTATANNK